MKKAIGLSIFIIAIILILLGLQLYSNKTSSQIEQYKYDVISTDGSVEIRSYEPALFTSVVLPSNTYKKSSSQGFRTLAGYIFGGNENSEKIAMTSPVTMSLGDSMQMMFKVPEEYDKDQLPKPNDSQIKFEEVPAKRMAAIRFGGWSNDKKIEEHKKELLDYLNKNNIPHSDNFLFYGYNPPYEIFNRRNEVLVELI
ncbi:heme-binding protein [Saprospiraceae bacterium]|nr:heme-binding protein [Saprospiraceae bacterium]